MTDEMSSRPAAPTGAPFYNDTVNPAIRPDRLALASWLNGGPRPTAGPHRILELGCGPGVNLLPLAYYHPESRFVGLDPAAPALAAIQDGAGELGLTNIRVEQCSWGEIPSLDDLDGAFDYIILFNWLSWLAPSDRDAVLAACGRLLAPEGIVYLDCLAPDGWAAWSNVRRLLRRLIGQQPDPDAEIAAIREAATVLAKSANTLPPGSPQSLLFAAELNRVAAAPPLELARALRQDPQMFDAVTLDELVSSHGLRRVCEADYSRLDPTFQARVQIADQLAETGLEGVVLEAMIDAASARRMRSAVLCRTDAPVATPPQPQEIAAFTVASDLAPLEPGIDVTEGGAVEFATPTGVRVSSDSPLLNTALLALASFYPRGIPVAALVDQVGDLLVAQGLVPEIPAAARDELRDQLFALHHRGAVELRIWEPELPNDPGWRPHPLAQYEAKTRPFVTGPLHQPVGLDTLTELTISSLAETGDPEAAVAAMTRQAAAGQLPLTQHGLMVQDPKRIDRLIRERVGAAAALLNRWGLLASE